jgi:hypothetical protein
MLRESWARLFRTTTSTHPDDLPVYFICILYVEILIILRNIAALTQWWSSAADWGFKYETNSQPSNA